MSGRLFNIMGLFLKETGWQIAQHTGAAEGLSTTESVCEYFYVYARIWSTKRSVLSVLDPTFSLPCRRSSTFSRIICVYKYPVEDNFYEEDYFGRKIYHFGGIFSTFSGIIFVYKYPFGDNFCGEDDYFGWKTYHFEEYFLPFLGSFVSTNILLVTISVKKTIWEQFPQ